MENPHVRRLCVAVDLRHYHRLDAADQNRAQTFLMEVLESACAATDIPRLEWTRQPKGDGELALLPPGVDEIDFVETFVAGLRRALHRHKRRHALRLRVRVSLHQGLTQLADAGYSGAAVVTVTRLCDAPQVKTMLEEHPDADLVLVLSAGLFEDVIGDDSLDLSRGAFRRVRIEMPEKDFYADAFVHLPGVHGSSTPATPVPATPGPGASSAQADDAHLSRAHAGTNSATSTLMGSSVGGDNITAAGNVTQDRSHG